MKKSKLLNVLDDMVNEDNQNNFSMVTYRTSKKTATMIELMSSIFQKPVSTLFTTMLSEKIVSNLFEDDSNIQLLNEYFESEHSNSGFVKLLADSGLIEQKIDISQILGDLDLSNLSEEAKDKLKKLQ